MLFIEYPKCSTCQKAKKYLISKGIEFTDRHIVEQTPTKEELMIWINESNLPIKSFFNTSGLVYKEMNLKERVATLSLEEAATLLSSNGMLIKRPLLVSNGNILLGFKEEKYDLFIDNDSAQ